MLTATITFICGAIVGTVAGYFVKKNNEKHFTSLEAKYEKAKAELGQLRGNNGA